MKKNLLIFLVIFALLAVSVSISIFMQNQNEISNQEEIASITKNSNLEILLNLGNFSKDQYQEEKLLEVAMLLAEKNGHMNETLEGTYVQYVNQSELHEMILEVTDISIEAPIQIEDFYYLYDSENEYYYCVPTSFAQYKLDNINHVYLNDDTYTIECLASKISEGETVSTNTITTTLKILENGLYTNYQIISQEVI